MCVFVLVCGVGDVAMLAADLVGPKGRVVGIDRSAEALDLARDRARGAGYANVKFRQDAAEDFADINSFDLRSADMCSSTKPIRRTLSKRRPHM
jgi:ubiquinone/menaquinone biosynthesis C-methylase UbiE